MSIKTVAIILLLIGGAFNIWSGLTILPLIFWPWYPIYVIIEITYVIISLILGITSLIGTVLMIKEDRRTTPVLVVILFFSIIGLFVSYIIGPIFCILACILGLKWSYSTKSPAPYAYPPYIPPPPPPPLPPPLKPSTDIEKIRQEIRRVEGYLEKLEEERRAGRITEQVYLKLKQEYESKLLNLKQQLQTR
ncbi:MAG: hypothetical protein QXR84_05970 [Candidatus Bathyarchaeia archaeon]